MLIVTIIFIVVSLVVSTICFIATSNLYLALGNLAVYILYYFIFLFKKIKKYKSIVSRVHSSYFFINSFIITLSVKESYKEGLESGIRIEDKQLHLYCNELVGLSDFEKVKYLRNYFKLGIYKMFLNIVEVYQDQGGNVLNMSDNLIRECTRTEKTLVDSTSIGIKHLIEFIVLWFMAFAVLIFMRFSLGEFYDKMLQNEIFIPLIFVFFLVCLFSVHLFFNSFLKLSIKEDENL